MNLMWHDMDYYYTVITNMFLIKTNNIVFCTLKHRKPAITYSKRKYKTDISINE